MCGTLIFSEKNHHVVLYQLESLSLWPFNNNYTTEQEESAHFSR